MADLASLSEHARGLHGVPAQCVPLSPGLGALSRGRDSQDTVPELCSRFPFCEGGARARSKQRTPPRHTSDAPLTACRSCPHLHSYILCLHGVLISWALIASTLGPSWYAHTNRAHCTRPWLPCRALAGAAGGLERSMGSTWHGKGRARRFSPFSVLRYTRATRPAVCLRAAQTRRFRGCGCSNPFLSCLAGCGRTCSSSCCWFSACLRTGRCRRRCSCTCTCSAS